MTNPMESAGSVTSRNHSTAASAGCECLPHSSLLGKGVGVDPPPHLSFNALMKNRYYCVTEELPVLL